MFSEREKSEITIAATRFMVWKSAGVDPGMKSMAFAPATG